MSVKEGQAPGELAPALNRNISRDLGKDRRLPPRPPKKPPRWTVELLNQQLRVVEVGEDGKEKPWTSTPTC
jgi:hypothetical protein